MDFSILVLSCDKYEACWEPFFGLLNKYYPRHPKAYLVCETKMCKFAPTINVNTPIWTKRFREALTQIDTDYVLVMLDDFFLRDYVDYRRINNIQFDEDTVVYNFEQNYRPYDEYNEYWGIQRLGQMYLNSCQPSLWNKTKLIERLQKDESAWDWEMTYINEGKNLINLQSLIMDIGNDHTLNWGVARGQITEECRIFLEKEGYFMTFDKKKLSIITPYYNTPKEIKELADVLVPQLTNEVEWIIIDDGCHEGELDSIGAKVIHLSQNSGGASKPRNIGLDAACGDYICFIDSDDMVSEDYVASIIAKIKEEPFGYCYFSWEYLLDPTNRIIIEKEPPEWNQSIWNCVYSRKLIGSVRFDETKRTAEDAIFNMMVRKGEHTVIPKILYKYNTGREDNLSRLIGSR